MSIRLRLTLLYCAILALTLAAFGIGIYEAVSSVTLSSARSALADQVRTVAISLQPHLGPGPGQEPGGGQGPGGSGPSGQGPNGGGMPPHGDGAQQNSSRRPNLGSFIPPSDVAAQSTVQVRNLGGSVIYQSSDLTAAKATLPLSAAARAALQPGVTTQTIAQVGKQRLLLATTLVAAHGVSTGILQMARSLHDVDQTLSYLREILLAGGGIALLLACGAGWWLAGTGLRPINRITQTAHAIGVTQDFGRRVVYSGPADEVGRLAGTFNDMLAALQAAFQAQRRFVADASHELRTPLTTIRGNLGLLQREPPIAEADRVAVVADLVSESERLSRLVGDLLRLARTDTGRPLRHEPVPLEPLVADVARRLAVTQSEQAIEVAAAGDAVALGDADAITQVLLILLDNALKFTPPAGKVAVSTELRGERAVLDVRDTGPGIAPEALPHIFERFFQGDAVRTGTGTGLGLAIAKALVDGMGGSIEVESRVGVGTTFSVTLPRAPRNAPHAS